MVIHLQQTWSVGQVRACRAMKFSRTSHRYQSQCVDQTPLCTRIREIAFSRVHYGY